jgi:DNA-binding response OmpR family regulator
MTVSRRNPESGRALMVALQESWLYSWVTYTEAYCPAGSRFWSKLDKARTRAILMNQSCVILLVENDKDFIYLLEQAFRKAEIRNPLKIARYGNEAILYLRGVGIYGDRQCYPLPRFIILDLTNPDGSSMALLGWIREQAEFVNVPILVLAGQDQQNEVQHAFDRGANAFIVKEGNLVELTQAVTKLEIFSESHRQNMLSIVALTPQSETTDSP